MDNIEPVKKLYLKQVATCTDKDGNIRWIDINLIPVDPAPHNKQEQK